MATTGADPSATSAIWNMQKNYTGNDIDDHSLPHTVGRNKELQDDENITEAFVRKALVDRQVCLSLQQPNSSGPGLGKKSTERSSWAHFHRSKQELDAAQLVLAGLPADWLQGDRIGPVTQTRAADTSTDVRAHYPDKHRSRKGKRQRSRPRQRQRQGHSRHRRGWGQCDTDTTAPHQAPRIIAKSIQSDPPPHR